METRFADQIAQASGGAEAAQAVCGKRHSSAA
jgi:hypothetical protein